jgi:hypothetical protein
MPPDGGSVSSMSLNCAIRETGPMIWIQPPFMPRSTRFSSSNVSSAFCWSQRLPETGSTAIPNVLRSP